MKMHPLAEGFVRSLSSFHTFLFRSIGLTGPGAFRQTLILTTRGRKTGRESSVPLLYVEENGKLYIVASFGGNDVASWLVPESCCQSRGRSRAAQRGSALPRTLTQPRRER